MNLPRHATIYVIFIGLLSLFQLMLGANLIVLAALDIVSLVAIYPITRATFEPTDLLMAAFSLYYGTFSLFFKCTVLQPVQQNLVMPLTTSAYLVSGFGMIFVTYYFVRNSMTKYFPGTQLRRWNAMERTYADVQFLRRFTPPVTILALAIAVVSAIGGHSAQEVSNGLAAGSGIAALGSLTPLIQLALAMQLTLWYRSPSQIGLIMLVSTGLVSLGLSIFNNSKLMAFMLLVTFFLHSLAYKLRLKPQTIAAMVLVIAIGFLYIIPLVHIIRDLDVEKSDRLSRTFEVLSEADYNPLNLYQLEDRLQPGGAATSLDTRVDYLYPYNIKTDRFTLIMPIDLIVREEGREPLGFAYFVNETLFELLPSSFVGEHRLDNMADHISWRYSIRENNVVARARMGLLGTGYGIGGVLGIFVLMPFMMLLYFAFIKFTCNGSVWENPWAIFIGSVVFFESEADMTLPTEVLRGMVPLLIIAWGFTVIYRIFSKPKFL